MMRHVLCTVLLLASVVTLTAGYLPQGPDYSQYDPKKLDERYSLIQALVRPQTAYRPRIGAAYAQPVYNKAVTGYKNQAYAPMPVNKQVYANPSYAPAKSAGYATAGYSNNAPAQYGLQGYNGIRFGGGQVHPIFNNALLYKTKVDLGPYDSTDPIFIGGSTKATPNAGLRTAFNAQPSYPYGRLSPQIDAYSNRPSPNSAYPYYG